MDTYELVLPVESSPTDSTETDIRVDQLHRKRRMVLGNTHLDRAPGSRDIDNENVASGLQHEGPYNALGLNPLTVVGSSRELREDNLARSGHGPGAEHGPAGLGHDGSEARPYNSFEIDSLPRLWWIGGPRYIDPNAGCGVLHEQI